MKTIYLLLILLLAGHLSPAQIKKVREIPFKLQLDEGVRTLCFSSNSKRLIAGGDKGSLFAHDLQNGDTWSLPSHQAKVMALAFSYDNRYLASASEDGAFSLYDFQESKVLKVNGETGIVRDVTFSPTGRHFATSNEEGRISIWEVHSREKVRTLASRPEKILSLQFSPDGRLLATGSADKTAMLWEVETGNLLKVLSGHEDWVRALAFNEDGTRLVTGSYDRTLRIWDITTGTTLSTLMPGRDWVTDVHYSPDGRYLVAGIAQGLAVVLEPTGKVVQRLDKHSKMVGASPFSLDGKWIAVADLSPNVTLYDCSSLNITPWKPFDVTPPTIAVLSPKLLATKDAATGYRSSVVHQSAVRVLLEVTDLSGVREVAVNGKVLQPDQTLTDRYSLDLKIPLNTMQTITLVATDKAGNKLEDKLLIEAKPFSGSVDEKKYHAMLIAVQDYKDPTITDLDQPVRDLQKLKEVLLKNYSFLEENVTVVTNPDRNTLYAKFDELQSRLDKADNLLIFYAGHGYWDPQLEQGYWLPSDAEPNKRSSWLSNGTLRDYIAGIPARHTLLISDACFSGGIFKSRSLFESSSAAIETLYLRKSRKAMTSGTLEKVPDRSVFVSSLVQRLAENQEPYVTAEELFSGLKRYVIEHSPNAQVPQYGEVGQTGDEGGEFIFIRKQK
ncbi:MAG: caspase family protein [Cyclobacteriaceae bacterium]|nr:caspase family protein [Cyclobacteriaceae bacterium]